MKVYIGINGEKDICIDSEWIFSIDLSIRYNVDNKVVQTHCIQIEHDYADIVVKELLKIDASFRLISEEGATKIEFDDRFIRITTNQDRI